MHDRDAIKTRSTTISALFYNVSLQKNVEKDVATAL